MKNREIIERVTSLYNRGTNSDDSNLSNRHVYSVLKSNRNTLITQKIKKNQTVSQFNYQSLSCIDLIPAEVHECKELKYTNTFILKSKFPIPKLLMNFDKEIFSVMSVDGDAEYPFTTFGTKTYSNYNKYTSKIPRAYLHPNGHLFISLETTLDAVLGFGLFEEPIQASIFNSSCNDVTCKSYLDYEFPIDGELESALIQLTSMELIEEFKKQQEDVQNNSRDDSR